MCNQLLHLQNEYQKLTENIVTSTEIVCCGRWAKKWDEKIHLRMPLMWKTVCKSWKNLADIYHYISADMIYLIILMCFKLQPSRPRPSWEIPRFQGISLQHVNKHNSEIAKGSLMKLHKNAWHYKIYSTLQTFHIRHSCKLLFAPDLVVCLLTRLVRIYSTGILFYIGSFISPLWPLLLPYKHFWKLIPLSY